MLSSVVQWLGRANCQKGKVIVPAKVKKVSVYSRYEGSGTHVLSNDDIVLDDPCMGIGHGNFFVLGISSYWYNDQHQLILKDTPVTSVHNFLSMVPFAWGWLIVLAEPTSFKIVLGLIQY